MPNNAYLRSRRREQQLVREYREKGWDAGRTAGSKSPYDLYAVSPDKKRVHLIQVKTHKGGRSRRKFHMQRVEGVISCWTEVFE